MPTASLSSSSASILISSSLASPILSLNNYQTNTFCSIAITRFITLFQHIHSSKVPDKDTHTGVSKWVTCLKSIGLIKLIYSESKS